MVAVASLQIQMLSDILTVYEDRLEKFKTNCRTKFGGAKFVDAMIEEAQSEPQKTPLLQAIYHYYQKTLEMKKQIQQLTKDDK